MKTNFITSLQRDTYVEPQSSAPDPGKDTADYIDSHIVAAIVETLKKMPSDDDIESGARGFTDWPLHQVSFIAGANWLKKQLLKPQ